MIELTFIFTITFYYRNHNWKFASTRKGVITPKLILGSIGFAGNKQESKLGQLNGSNHIFSFPN